MPFAQPIPAVDQNYNLAEALDVYRQRVSILKKGFIQEGYRIGQISRSFLGSIKPRNITSVDIATYRDMRLQTTKPNSLGTISNATVRLELALLSNFFDIARIEWGLCNDNPVSKVRKPKIPPGRDRRLTAREERQLLRYAHSHRNIELYSILILALESAMRQGEILKLRWEFVNLKNRIAHLPETKNGTKRDVPLSTHARDALIRLGVKSAGPVFSYSSNGFKSTFRFLVRKLNIANLHFHDLRHEATSRLFELGTLDAVEIAAITGHKSLNMLKRYTHLRAQRLVRKLEGNKNKGKQYLFDHLIPYPAEILEDTNHIEIRLLDFSDEPALVTAPDRDTAVRLAQDLLMRIIVTRLKEARPIPPPDQYLEPILPRNLLLIDPCTH